LEHMRKVMGQEHPDTIQIMSNLGTSYSNQGRLEEAEPLFIEAVTLSLSVLGKQHPQTRLYINTLTEILRALKKFDDAREIALLLV
jgi:Tetratricopeptide repeat